MRETLTGDHCRWFSRISTPNVVIEPPQTVVLVHGVVVSGDYFRPVANLLDAKYRVLVPDLPGTGQSVSYRGRLTLNDLADALAWWLDVHEVQKAVLVANSMGCQVLTQLAVQRPDLASALVLVSPTMDPVVSRRVQAMIRGVIDLPRESPGLWPVWFNDARRTSLVGAVRSLGEAIRDPQLERASRIPAPVYVVGGERDPIAPPSWVRELASAFRHGEPTVIQAVPHAINFTSPEVLADVIHRAARGASLPHTMAPEHGGQTTTTLPSPSPEVSKPSF